MPGVALSSTLKRTGSGKVFTSKVKGLRSFLQGLQPDLLKRADPVGSNTTPVQHVSSPMEFG